MARPRFRQFLRHGFLPQLMAFEACLRLGSVTRAAEELSLAQPTVSGLLRRLSDTIGAPVLHQHHGRMIATAEGKELAFLCDQIFGALARYEMTRKVDPLPCERERHVPRCNFAYLGASEIFRADPT